MLQSERGQRRGTAEENDLNSRFDPPRQALAHYATAQTAGDDSFSPAAHRVMSQIALRERDLEGGKVVVMGDGEEPASALKKRGERQSASRRGASSLGENDLR